MSVRARMIPGAVALAVLGMLPVHAQASPVADFRFIETALGNGSYRYDYTLFNEADPVADAGYDLFEAWLFFGSGTVTAAAVPDGWDEIYGPGFLAAFSIEPGAPPIGADVAPGTSLSGFSITVDRQVGPLEFEAYFTNPIDPFDSPVFVGETRPFREPGSELPVPEPASRLLLGSGLAVLVAARRYSAS